MTHIVAAYSCMKNKCLFATYSHIWIHAMNVQVTQDAEMKMILC